MNVLPFGRPDPAPAPLFQSIHTLGSDYEGDTDADHTTHPTYTAHNDETRADAEDGDLLDPFLDSPKDSPQRRLRPLAAHYKSHPYHPAARIQSRPPVPPQQRHTLPTLDPSLSLSSPFLDAPSRRSPPRPPSPRSLAASQAHQSIVRLQRSHHPDHDQDLSDRATEEGSSSASYSDNDDNSVDSASPSGGGTEGTGQLQFPGPSQSGSLYDSTPAGSYGGRWGNPLRMHKAASGNYLAPPRQPTSLGTSSAFLQQDAYDAQLGMLEPSMGSASAASPPGNSKAPQTQRPSVHRRSFSRESEGNETDATETETNTLRLHHHHHNRQHRRRSHPDSHRRSGSGLQRSDLFRTLFGGQGGKPAHYYSSVDGDNPASESIPMLQSTTGSCIAQKNPPSRRPAHPRRTNRHDPGPNVFGTHVPTPLLAQGNPTVTAAVTWARERHDVWALVLFVLYVGPVLVLALIAAWGAPSLSHIPGIGGAQESLHDALLHAVPLLAFTSMVAAALGLLFVSVLRRLARAHSSITNHRSHRLAMVLGLFRAVAGSVPFGLTAASIALLGGSFSPSAPSSWLMPICAALCIVAAVRTGMRLWSHRKDLPKASRTSILAAHAIGRHPSLAFLAMATCLVLLIFSLCCLSLLTRIAAAVAASTLSVPGKHRGKSKHQDPKDFLPLGLSPIPLAIATVIAWGWAMATGLNAIKLITSASISHWYFYPPDEQPTSVTTSTEQSIAQTDAVEEAADDTLTSSGMSSAEEEDDQPDTRLPTTSPESIISNGLKRALGPALGSIMAASLLTTALTAVRWIFLLARSIVYGIGWLNHAALARTVAWAGQTSLPTPAAAGLSASVAVAGTGWTILGWVARILDPLAYIASLVVGVQAVLDEHASNAILYTGITGAPMGIASRRAAALQSIASASPAQSGIEQSQQTTRALTAMRSVRTLRGLGSGLACMIAALVAALGASYASLVRDEPGWHALVTAVVCALPPWLVSVTLLGLLVDAADTLLMCYLMDLAAGMNHSPLVAETFAPRPRSPGPTSTSSPHSS